MKQVTKEEFLKVYNEHAPNLFLRIMFKHFSTSMKKSLGTKIIVALFLVFNILAIILDNKSLSLRNMSLALANIPFALWGLTALVAFKWNQIRTTRVQKILGLTSDEYNTYAAMYLEA
jgi:hypothetical protein